MIIGYQIEDKHGRNWHDNLEREDKARTVLSERTAIEVINHLKKLSQNVILE